MRPERLQEIARPIHSALRRYGFEMDGEPMAEGSVIMASFVSPAGGKLDYALEVIKDVDRGNYWSDSEVELNVRMFKDGEIINLPLRYGSNMPATQVVEDNVRERLEPKLKEHFSQPAQSA